MAKKIVKRIISIILVLNMILGCFSGCAGTNQTTGEYMTKGEFFAAFIDLRNLYSDNYTAEEMENSETYDIEAQIMVEWGLLTEKQVRNTHKPVTLEIVAQACVNNIFFRQTHNIEIKNISKAEDPQAIMDAVGMGLVNLKNNKFEYNKKLTRTDVDELFAAMYDIEINAPCETGDIEVEFADGVIDARGIETAEFRTYTVPVSEMENMSFANVVSTNTLGLADSTQTKSKQTTNTEEMCEFVEVRYETIGIINNRTFYNQLKKGNTLVVPESFQNKGLFSNTLTFFEPIGIEIMNVFTLGIYTVVQGKKINDIEGLIKDSEEGQGINKLTKIPATSYKQNYTFDKFSIKPLGNGIRVTYKDEYKWLMEKMYSGSQAWRNSTFNPTIEIAAEISNISLKTENIGKMLLGKTNSKSELMFLYDTAIDVKVGTGNIKYAPANTGNGGLKFNPEDGFSGNLFANVSNARFTGGTSGSDGIKLVQVEFPLGTSGFSFRADLYLIIGLDGELTFSIKQSNSYMIKFDNGKFQKPKSNSDVISEDVKLNMSLSATLSLQPNLRFFGVNVMDGYIALAGQVDAGVNFFTETELIDFGYDKITPTSDNLTEACNQGWNCCIDVYAKVYLKYGLLTEVSVIGKIVKKKFPQVFDSLKFETAPFFEYSSHSENGELVEECTRGLEQHKPEKNANGEIVLDSYKYFMTEYTCIHANLLSAPVDEELIGDYIIIKSGNEDVVTATYIPSLNAISLNGNGAGSTEVEIKIRNKDNKKKKEYYTLCFSVTVNAMTDISSDGIIDEAVPFDLFDESPWLVGERYL